MTQRIAAWQCIGCGRIEGAQPCVGICEDRRREFVAAEDHDAALAAARRERDEFAALVRRIAHTTPRPGECERTWLALQAQARVLLESPAPGERDG